MLSDRKSQNLGLKTKKDPAWLMTRQPCAVLHVMGGLRK